MIGSQPGTIMLAYLRKNVIKLGEIIMKTPQFNLKQIQTTSMIFEFFGLISTSLIITSMLLVSFDSYARFKIMEDKETETIKKADDVFDKKQFEAALPLYLKLNYVHDTDTESNYRIGVCYLNSDNSSRAILFLDNAANSPDAIPESNYYLGRAYHLYARFDDAINAYQKFIDIKKPNKRKYKFWECRANRQIELCMNAKEIMSNPVNVVVENAGTMINTPNDDHSPIITFDESGLLFTNQSLDENDLVTEKVYYTKNENNAWSTPQYFGKSLNSWFEEAISKRSTNKTANVKVHSYAGIYYTQSSSEVVEFPLNKKYRKVLEECSPNISLTKDGNTKYFVSNQKGGYGGKDIWKVFKLPSGEWGKPVNLGCAVNTAYDEDMPFMHPDNITLYFSSKGHNSTGGYDIFKSVHVRDKQWTNAENVGYPINSPNDDMDFVLTCDGTVAYFTSVRETGLGGKDIYKATFPKQSVNLAVLSGYLLDYNNDPRPNAKIVVCENESGGVILSESADPQTGEYSIVFNTEPDKGYSFSIQLENGSNLYSKEIKNASHTGLVSLTENIFMPKNLNTKNTEFMAIDE